MVDFASAGLFRSVESAQDSFPATRSQDIISSLDCRRSRKRRMSLDDCRTAYEWDGCSQDSVHSTFVQPPLFIIRHLCLEAAEKRASQLRASERESPRKAIVRRVTAGRWERHGGRARDK
mmetsp:Transcript_59818/g.122752  ORF Transcript_59818/g.122752 Transcript_59818/m.122752 type:complete len:120 (+) Transcript_59818:456-815(+)